MGPDGRYAASQSASLCVVGIGGEPATGKSQLVQAMLARLPAGARFRFGRGIGTVHRAGSRRWFVLGVYDDKPYPGTDRICKRFPPEFPALLDHIGQHATGPSWVLFEGQRLFTATVIAATIARTCRSRFFLLTARHDIKACRRAQRQDAKRDVFLRGAATQCRNIRERFGPEVVTELPSNGPADLERNVAMIAATLQIA